MWRKLKIAAVAAFALAVLVVVLQNTGSVETRILFFTVTMSRSALLLATLVAGFIIGVLTTGKMVVRKKD